MDLSKHCHNQDFTSLQEVSNRSQSIFNLHASAHMLSLRLAASQVLQFRYRCFACVQNIVLSYWVTTYIIYKKWRRVYLCITFVTKNLNVINRRYLKQEGIHFLSDGLSEVNRNLKLTVQFLRTDFAAVSELSGKNLRWVLKIGILFLCIQDGGAEFGF